MSEPKFQARVTVVLSTGTKLVVGVTDDEAVKVLKLLTKFGKTDGRREQTETK